MIRDQRTALFQLIAALFAAAGPMAWAQLTTAGVSGAVKDSQGLAVAGVQIAATNEDTGQKFTTQTNETGQYFLRALPVGRYSIVAETRGFKSYRRSGIELTANQLATIDIQLELGALTETISVTAELSPVDTSTGTLGTLVDTRRVEELPLNGRNVLALVELTPGVTRASIANGPSFGQQSINVNGGRAHSTNIMLDGASMYYAHRGAGLTAPPPDAVQEVKIITSGVSAEFKRGSAAVSTITRGGTNEFHGSLWNYFRNDALDARSFFASRVSKLRYNQFGATTGGPIIRNKAFFFGAFQGFENPSDRLSSSGFPPTTEERNGDLSKTSGTRPVDPLSGQPFPNSIVPKSRMDPVALKLLDRIALPNRPNGQYVTQVSVPTSDRMYMGRVDYDFRPGDRTTFRYFLDNPASEDPFPNGSNVDGYCRSITGNRSQNWNLAHAHTFSPALLMNLRASVTRFRYYETNTVRETLASLGAKFVTGGGPGSLPLLSVTGRFTAAASREGDRIGDTHEGGIDLSWFRGRHELKFGGDLQWIRFYYGNSDRSYGEFFFDGTFTKNSLGDFLLGQPARLWQQKFRDNDVRYYAPGFYLQDRWRATRRLTINAGLRWEIYTPWRMVNTPAFAFVPGARSRFIPSAPAGVLYDIDPGFPLQLDALNAGPRVGFAFDVFGNGKTSLRGGYGISYDPLIGQISAQNSQPFAPDLDTNNVGPLSDPQRFVQVPYGKPVDLNNPVFVMPITMGGSWVGEIVTPYVQNVNLTLEQQVMADTMLQASYVATLGRHEGTLREQNPAVYIPGRSTTRNTDERRIHAPVFGALRGFGTDGNSAYHALQVTLSRRFAKGLTYSVAYAFAKAIDEASRNDAANNWWTQDPYNRRGNRGLGDNDIRNRFVASWIWELPVLRQQRNLVGKIFGGWQFSGIATLEDGTPFTVSSGRDNSLTGVGQDRPHLTGDPRLPTNRPTHEKLARYFDTSKFVPNGPGEYGNAGRNILIGPGEATFSLSLSKTFAVTESKRVEFRWDAFNAFNRANFGNPGGNLSSATNFGRITSAGGGRVMQLALRFEF